MARPGRIELRARRQGAVLELSVVDNGRGLDPARAGREGIGLANTRARLRALYGDQQQLDLKPNENGGLCAQVRIPWSGRDFGTRSDAPGTP